MSTLDELVAATRETVARRRDEMPLDRLRSQISSRGSERPFTEALVGPGLSLIAEFKRRSPSAGEIRAGAEIADIVAAYEGGGASAISVLTEESGFGGSVDDLRVAREITSLPILRKDFTVDAYQVHEAAAAGADAVLLIVAALDDDELESLYDEAGSLQLDCLVEVHGAEELERALTVDAELIGINNRDLRDLTVDTSLTGALMTEVPAGKTVVAESGYERRDQLEDLERIGVDAVLIGEALMRSTDPEAIVRELTSDEETTREHYI